MKRFGRVELEEGPLAWVSVKPPTPSPRLPEPAAEEELWTDPEYVIAATEDRLANTIYLGDALPVHCPWLGPDQFAGWLGADLVLAPRTHNTSWAAPFLDEWQDRRVFNISPDNQWWKLYLEITRRSADAGRDKWITGYPDLHAGVDALSAIRGFERFNMDLIERPELVLDALQQMTRLWKEVVDTVAGIIEPGGQGASNWTMGWSDKRFLCVGHYDFTCMISPRMFDQFCREDLAECCRHVDHSIYHLDGPGAIRHLPSILSEPALTCVQWIPGAGSAPMSHWIPLLKEIQASGKSVQIWPCSDGGEARLLEEIQVACEQLDVRRLFIVAEVTDRELGAAAMAKISEVSRPGMPK